MNIKTWQVGDLQNPKHIQWLSFYRAMTPRIRSAIGKQVSVHAEVNGYSGETEVEDAIQYVWEQFLRWLPSAKPDDNPVAAIDMIANSRVGDYKRLFIKAKGMTGVPEDETVDDIPWHTLEEIMNAENFDDLSEEGKKVYNLLPHDYLRYVTSAAAEDVGEHRETLEGVQRILARQPRTHSELYTRVVIDGESYDEACAAMNLRHSALARKIVSRIKARIIKELL